MPMRSNRRDDFKPTRLDSNESPKGRDISGAVDRAAKSRTVTSLSGSAKSRC
jgi:hypothetical protein